MSPILIPNLKRHASVRQFADLGDVYGQPAAERKQSRRALFAGAAGAGVGAVAATVLGGVQPASAATGDNCLLGELNTASSTTSPSTLCG